MDISFNKPENKFYLTLRNRVNDYFKSNNLSKTGNRKIYTKAIILMLSLGVIYTVLVFFTPPVWISILLCVLLGVSFAVIGFNIMHDAAHGSFTKSQKANNVISHVLNLLGANVFLWKEKHNIIHHTFTNIHGKDDDIALEPFIRVHQDQEARFYHRFQHYYFVLLYGLNYLLWVFVSDFQKYFSGKISGTAFKKPDLKEHFIFWGSKLFYLGVFFVIPMIMVGVVPALIGYLIAAFACGLFMAIVFQLAHLTELTQTPDVQSGEGDSKSTADSWPVHQVLTTADFAVKSRVVNWLTGGLNFQVVHHLFPQVSHIHYPQLQKIVKQTCAEYDLGYNEFPTLYSAVKSHVLFLKKAGRPQV